MNYGRLSQILIVVACRKFKSIVFFNDKNANKKAMMVNIIYLP